MTRILKDWMFSKTASNVLIATYVNWLQVRDIEKLTKMSHSQLVPVITQLLKLKLLQKKNVSKARYGYKVNYNVLLECFLNLEINTRTSIELDEQPEKSYSKLNKELYKKFTPLLNSKLFNLLFESYLLELNLNQIGNGCPYKEHMEKLFFDFWNYFWWISKEYNNKFDKFDDYEPIKKLFNRSIQDETRSFIESKLI